MTNSKYLGFTLLELLVALSIFAIISLGAFKLITQIISYHQRSEERMNYFQSLSIMLNLIEKDLLQAIDRPIRDEFGDRLPALIGDSEKVELTHGGWVGRPLALQPDYQAQAELKRTLYSLELNYQDGRYMSLWARQQWDVLDRVQHSRSVQTLAIPVNQATIRYLSHERHWSTEWPSNSGVNPHTQQRALPLAIELALVTEKFGSITRLFEVSR